jgi:hypothetical protein
MRVCPKCGFHDSPYWIHYRWVNDIDVAQWADFLIDYPQFAEKRCGEIWTDDHHYYRRSSFKKGQGRRVLRWSKDLGKDYYNMRDFEPSGARARMRAWKPLPDQTRLLEVPKENQK